MDNVKELYENTEHSMQEIADKCGLSFFQVWYWVKNNYSQEVRKARKVKCYANSKQGNKNPMFGKTLDQHHNYIGPVEDGKGYLMVVKPDWYTGRKGTKHVFEHHVVMCTFLGITEIPPGFCVHHIDHNPKNNHITNLALLTIQAHTRLHAIERATTRAKARRVQEDSKRLAEVVNEASDDIV